MKSILLGTAFLLFSNVLHGKNENQALVEMLANAKVSGMCGVFGQMARFQASTQVENGDEFVARFAYAEAARFGQTLDEFSATCASATERYDALMLRLREGAVR